MSWIVRLAAVLPALFLLTGCGERTPPITPTPNQTVSKEEPTSSTQGPTSPPLAIDDLCQKLTTDITKLFQNHGINEALECAHPTSTEWVWAAMESGSVLDVTVASGPAGESFWALIAQDKPMREFSIDGQTARMSRNYGLAVKLPGGVYGPGFISPRLSDGADSDTLNLEAAKILVHALG